MVSERDGCCVQAPYLCLAPPSDQELAVTKRSVKVKKKKKKERKHTPFLHITIMRKTHLVGHDLMSSDYTHD